jgi:translin
MDLMLDSSFFQKLKQLHSSNERERQKIITESNKILHSSKRAIFALHRKESQAVNVKLRELEDAINGLQEEFGAERINREGSYKAAIEEYVEARFFYEILQGNTISDIPEVDISFDSYLAGLCDLPGELARKATNEAAAGNNEEVENIKSIVNQLLGELSEFDMTGYLRTKFDQAKNALRRVEQINYEVRIRKN